MSAQVLVNGILLGGIYALVGVGFSLVWGVMNVINVAHGAFVMIGAFVAFWLFTLWGVDPLLALPLAMGVLFVLGYGTQLVLINRVIRAPLFMTLIVTFGLELLLVNAALLLWTADPRSVTTSYSSAAVALAGVQLPTARVAIFLLALLLAGGLQLFLARTRQGNAIRATRMDREAAQLMGARIDRVYAFTFGLGAAMAGAAGALLSTISAITPAMGIGYTAKAFAVCVLGGLGSITGALVGGLLLGLFEVVGASIIGPAYQDLISYLVLVLVLVVRPSGILGQRYYQ
jgi:branched-chain amino acid transport system permease protein